MKSFAFNRSRNEKLYDSSLTVSLREPNPKDLLSELTIGLLSNNNDNDHYATDEKKNVTLLSSLESNEIEKIYRRMPELQVEEQQEFQVREKSMKPPKALESNILQFPLQEDLKIEKPKELEDEENRLLNSDLEVLRYLPEGEIKDRSVPFISITFSQPMIKLTTVNQVENQTIPVQIEPIPKNGGRWRWIGTNTLQYEPNYRFDMSTEYTVTIPQGTTSVLGGQLKKDVKFTFSTPRALVRSHLPSSGSIHPVNEVPVYYLEFDQEIDPKEVIPYISVEGKPEVRAKLINVDEIRKMLTEYNFEKRTHSYSLFDSKLKSAPSDRHVWFTLENKDTSIVTMALGEQVKLIVTEGVPSLEGPLKSNEKYEFTVTNYDELKVERNVGGLIPMDPFRIEFNNSLDEEGFSEDMITIEPIIERKNVSVSGGYLTIGGNIKGRTTYVVTLSENIRDVWGQSLKKSVSVTYNVGKARPSLQAFQSGLIVLDPTVNEKPSFSVFTVNLDKIHVTVTQVTPEMYSNDVFNKNNIIGNKVLDAIINTNGQPDEPTTTDIDLTLCLQNPKENLGQLMVWVEPDKESWTSEWEYRPVLTSWIQVTKLALDCIYEPTSDSVYAWANSLASGEKLTDVKINVKSTTEVQGLDKVISEDGVNRIKLSINSESNNNLLVYAEKDNDVCFIPSIYIYKNYFSNSTVSQFYNDRGLYKPNEEIFIKGFVREIRWVDDNTRYEIGLPNARTINYTVQDAFGKEYHKGTCELSASGSCNFSFTIPDNVNLGYHAVRINTGGDSEVYHNFQCQEFRTPEFIVYSSIPVSNYIVNGSAVCTTSATYYSGGGLSGSSINYTVRQSIANYSPPNWRGFVFDDSQRERYVRTSQVSNFNSSVDGNGEHKIVIDFNENDRIHKLPITLQVESLVQDINRQTIATSSNLIVHPCPLYCGVRLNKNYIQPKQNNEMQLIVTNIDGKPVEGVEMKVTIEKTEWKYKGMKYIKEQKLIKEDLLISTTDPLKYYLNVNEGGSYKVKVNIVDKETNLTNKCSTPFYAFGRDLNGEKQFGKRIREKSVTLISDKPYYEVGDVAKITVQSPFNGKSEGIIYFSLRGLIHKDYITIDPEKGFTEYSFPITKQHIPNLIVNVTLVGSEKRVDDLGKELNDIPNQPAYANGSLSLPVSKLIHELTVDIVPESQFVTPGAKTKVEVIVKDKDGNLQENSEVTLIAIDEAILSLTNHKITNPLDTFIFNYYSGFSNYSIRGNLFVKDYSAVRVEQEEVRERMMARNSGFAMEEGVFLCSASSVNSSGMMFGGMDMGCVATTTTSTRNAPMCLCDEDMEGGEEGGSTGPTINIRKNFNPVAVFEPTVLTNKEGKATIEFNLPDNLTKYRLTAIAVKDEVKAGVKESFIVAQLPLAIRPSLPRFLNFGDKAEFTCVLVNQTPITLPVNVAIRFTNLSILDESKRGLQVTIPSSERVELRFPLQTEKVGIAKFQIGVTIANQSINFADAVEKEIRVFTPATSEAFATYGEIDGTNNIFQKIEKPKDVYNQFGGLDITTSSTALSSLTDAFLYLYRYPYDCSEQLASKLISTVSLKDVLQSFNVKEIPSSQEIDKFINETLNCLYKKQFPNGGYGFWSYYNNAEVCPYVTVFVCYSFVLAIKAGYNVDENNLQKLVHIISNIESHCEKYTMECKNSIKSFSYFVLSVLYQLKQNRNVMVGVNAQQLSQSIIKLYKETGMNTNLENLIWMAHGLYLTQNHQIGNECNEILQYILKNVNETAETANFITNYGDNQNSKLIMLHSSRRTDGIILNSLIEMDKKNTLIPKIVKGLLAHKKKGRWNNTQENVYILVALNNYFHTFENIVPDFITRIWLGEEYCGEQTFKGRSKDENLVQIPMSFLLKEEEEQENTLVIAKEGQGRLYYRLGLNSAPKNLLLPAVSYGFTVERTFEGVTSKDHVQFDVTRNCWRFKAGEVIRVKLTLSTTSRRYHVALVDYLPACLEALNPELKGTPNITDDTNEESKLNCCWWNRTWYEHQNLRDERVEAFTSFLLEGSHEFKYFARVTSIGSFVIPPTKAEEMYCPELFGRTGTEFVEIFE